MNFIKQRIYIHAVTARKQLNRNAIPFFHKEGNVFMLINVSERLHETIIERRSQDNETKKS